MHLLIALSLLINVAVLIPVCASLVTDAAWVQAGFGPPSPARSILLSVYMAIGVVSAVLLWIQEPRFVATLLLIQLVYKLTTPLTVGTLSNPIVVSNLLIAALHSITLVFIWRNIWREPAG